MNRPALSWLIFSLSAIGLIRAKCLADAPANGLTEAERRGGWKLLFDGKTAKGWRNFRKDTISDGWRVEGGALIRAKNGAGDIITNEQFKFFELSLEYRISKGGNSGLFFHVTEEENNRSRMIPKAKRRSGLPRRIEFSS